MAEGRVGSGAVPPAFLVDAPQVGVAAIRDGGGPRMNEVEAKVRELSERMAAAGGRPFQGKIADPRQIWELLRAERPDLAKAVVRLYPGQPQAQVGRWVPGVGEKP